MNKMKKVYLYLLFILILIESSFAIGLSPASKTIAYTPEPQTLTYYIVNSEHKDQTIKVELEGNLSKYASLDKGLFELKKDDYLVPFTLRLNLPQEKAIGEINLYVSGVNTGEEQISANIRIRSILKIIEEKPSTISGLSLEEETKKGIKTNDKEEPIKTPSGKASNIKITENSSKKEKSPYVLYFILALLSAVFLLTSILILNKPKKDVLQEYIGSSRKNNIPDSEIKEQLLKVGWKEEQINKYFK